VLHLVADESTRAGYVLCVAAVAIDDVDAARTAMRGFLLPGQRSVHFKSERDARRRQILDTIANLGAETLIVSCASGRGDAERHRCLRASLRHYAERRPGQLTLDHRDPTADTRDRQVIADTIRTLGLRELAYRHAARHEEPLLWIPDAIAWSFTRGGAWRQRVRRFADIVDV
jgi:hypothetical protein